MSTFQHLSHSFEVPEISKRFLELYIARVNSYVEKYSIDSQLLQDLHERLLEKLSDSQYNNTLSEKEIITIVNSLGEPEDIFKDYIEIEKSSFSKNTLHSFLKKDFHKNSHTGVILGVCSGIAEMLDVNPIWIRLFFLLCLPIYGFIIILYIVLGILLPDANQANKTKPVEKSTIENTTNNTHPSFIGRLTHGVQSIFVSTFKSIGLITKFCIFFGISAILFSLSFGVIGLAGMVSANPVIDNQYVFSFVPVFLPFVAFACGIAGIILAIITIAQAFGKKIGNIWLITICFLILASGIFTSIQVGVKTISTLSQTYEKVDNDTKDYIIQSGSTIIIDLQNLSNYSYDNRFLDFSSPFPNIQIEPSDDASVHVKTTASIRTTEENKAQEILEAILPLETKFEKNSIFFRLSNKNDFTKIVPFTLLERKIYISIPKDSKVQIIGSYRNINKDGTYSEVSSAMKQYNVYGCDGEPRVYDEKSQNFLCTNLKAMQDEMQERQRDYLESQGRNFFEPGSRWYIDISSIQEMGSGTFEVTWENRDGDMKKMQVKFSEDLNTPLQITHKELVK